MELTTSFYQLADNPESGDCPYQLSLPLEQPQETCQKDSTK